MDYQEFLDKIPKIKAMGFVASHRVGDTGIGKTLEDLLGIQENNIQGPDLTKHELKAARKNSDCMLTLFSKAPQPDGANKDLLDKCGYPTRTNKHNFSLRDVSKVNITKWIPDFNVDSSNNSSIVEGEKELHISIDSMTTNSCGLRLSVKENTLYFDNDKGALAYYDNETLREAFEKKYPNAKLIYVLAECQGGRNHESFHYVEAYRLADGFSFDKFSQLIVEGKMKVDIRIGHFKDGKLHDHGTAFRILPKYFPQCFETIENIL